MTGPDDSQGATRPISVAELLAKNGSIGSRPVGGGRRRKRRGNSDAVTVAELTGEIPIIRVDDSGALPVVADDDLDADLDGDTPEPETGTNGHAVDTGTTPSPLQRASEPMPRRGRDAAPELSAYPRPVRPAEEPALASDAEAMSPDPIEDVDVVGAGDAGAAEDAEQADGVVADELGLGDTGSAVGEALLFGGDTMADELARGAGLAEPIAGDLSDDLVDDPQTAEDYDDVDLSDGFDGGDDDYDYDYDEPTRGQLIGRGALAALQSVLAVAFGAGLFLAFDRLWLWNSMVAMVLAILVTLGLVAGVWVVRKTEDIASTLIAVGVGLLVTFGPLALMHAT